MTAHTHVSELPYAPSCPECTRFKADEEKARYDRDPSKEVDYRVLARRHLRNVHGVAVAG
ncbi:hypothetical protein [Streptomyces sp. RPT161]|uniref:hypothetical protein n=1 Tax=Streptomyces sp. RPT161 TaxID=3015993 RepID=UPI0022B929DE|nr:hypothetical protein [Streptomyces sp. RPT161]